LHQTKLLILPKKRASGATPDPHVDLPYLIPAPLEVAVEIATEIVVFHATIRRTIDQD
jgi:hypothetical protein